MVKIRKEKRTAELVKRRQLEPTPAAISAGVAADSAPRMQPTRENIEALAQQIRVGERQQAYEAIQEIRRMLSSQVNPPTETVVDLGLLPLFVQCLDVDDARVQFEAAWALTNVASGTSALTRAVVGAGAVPGLIRLMGSPDLNAREQAVWALGNIAGDSSDLRDLTLRHQMVPKLLDCMHTAMSGSTPSHASMLRNAVWAVSNLCRSKPPPDFALLQPAIPYLATSLRSDEPELLADACWALSYLSDAEDQRVQMLVDTGAVPRLVQLTCRPQYDVQLPALRTVGNIVSGTHEQTQAVLNAGVLPSLLGLLNHNKRNIRKEAAWTVSNISAGKPEQLESLLQSTCMERVVVLALHDEMEIRKECVWALSNMATVGTREQVVRLVQLGTLRALLGIMDDGDVNIVSVALEGFENVMKKGQEYAIANGKPADTYVTMALEVGAADALQYLLDSENDNIYQKALHITTSYFPVDEEESDGEVAPSATQSTFSFGDPRAVPGGVGHATSTVDPSGGLAGAGLPMQPGAVPQPPVLPGFGVPSTDGTNNFNFAGGFQ